MLLRQCKKSLNTWGEQEVSNDNLENATNFDEKQLYKIVGENCRRARVICNLTMKEAQAKIWNYKNKEMHPNRMSELESGQKKIDLKILYLVAKTYGVSVDYLLGLSNDFENNPASSHCGLIFNSVRDSVLETTDRICSEMSRLMRHLPPYQGELLKDSAKNMNRVIYEAQLDLAFRAQYPHIIEAHHKLAEDVRMFETVIAKYMRMMELTMIDQINRKDSEIVSMTMSEKESIPNSEKC